MADGDIRGLVYGLGWPNFAFVPVAVPVGVEVIDLVSTMTRSLEADAPLTRVTEEDAGISRDVDLRSTVP